MFNYLSVTTVLGLLCILKSCTAWNNDEMEIFDAVEEIGQNFYELLGVPQNAELSEVKKAYRSLSRQLHPDKNDAPDAEIKFRQMVSAYDIIKDEGKRTIYNRVLVEGLPDWRSPIFYFRRARKMSLFEISIILTVVISITQYLMAWGSFIDRKHTLEEVLIRKYKITKDKKRRKNEDSEIIDKIEHVLKEIPRPSLWNILPIQIVRFVIFLFTGAPDLVKQQINLIKEMKQEKEDERIRQEEEAQKIKEMDERRKEMKAQKKERKRVNKLPDKTGEQDIPVSYTSNGGLIHESESSIPVITGGPWTDEDFSELSRLMAKFPGGTIGRWELIAEQLNRTVYEVTKMSNKVKAQLNKQTTDDDNTETTITKVKVKTKTLREGEKIDLSLGADDKWPVAPQKALEKALKMFPKGIDQRWDKIARCVPEKSKEECIIRFKYLAEKIKKKKEENLQVEDKPSETIVDKDTHVENINCTTTNHH